MSFLNPLLLSGLGLVTIPVILHLLLRPKPKQLIFPALRLIRDRRKQNVRRFRLRHWWLLFLRMAVIGVIVLALTRPTLPAANYSLSRSELLTLITVIGAGISTYYLILNRWQRSSLPRYAYEYRRSTLRGWSTLVILLALLAAVGWPYYRRVLAEIKSPPTTRQLDIPVAAVFLFDTSLSMGYLHEGRTRLEEARRFALEHLSELPAGSRVAVSENSSDNPLLFQPTLHAAQERIRDLQVRSVALPLSERIRTALMLQRDDRQRVAAEFGGNSEEGGASSARHDRFVRRIYVFTDLARSAWRFTGSRILQNEIEEFENLGLYLIDVGELQPQNLGITAVHLSKEKIPVGGNLFVGATVTPRGMADQETIVELYLADPAGNLAKHGQQTLSLFGDTPQEVQFPPLHRLTGPVIHGEVRLVSSDPLDVDDSRFFSVAVGEPPRVIVFAPNFETADNWLYALNPTEQPKFEVEFVPSSQLAQTSLTGVDVVYLVNVPRVTDSDWRRLGQFVDEGGGLGIFLGSDNIESDSSYNRAQAQVFLPARLDAWQPRNNWQLTLGDTGHPLLRKYRQYDGVAILENDVRIYRFWRVEPAEGTLVLAQYTDPLRSPALLERIHGRGRTVMFTTDVDLKEHPWRWNNFPSPTVVPWVFVAFAEQMTEHLAGTTDVVLNYSAGEDVFLRFEPRPEDRSYLLRQPGLTQVRVTQPAGRPGLVIERPEHLGHYHLSTVGDRREVLTGFSVNVPPGESDFTRLLDEDLHQLLGEDRYRVARSIQELEGEILATDIGQEMFPIILVLVIVFFCGEHFVANRFYDPEAEQLPEGPKSTVA